MRPGQASITWFKMLGHQCATEAVSLGRPQLVPELISGPPLGAKIGLP